MGAVQLKPLHARSGSFDLESLNLLLGKVVGSIQGVMCWPYRPVIRRARTREKKLYGSFTAVFR